MPVLPTKRKPLVISWLTRGSGIHVAGYAATPTLPYIGEAVREYTCLAWLRDSHLPDVALPELAPLRMTRRLSRFHRAGPSTSLDKSLICTCKGTYAKVAQRVWRCQMR